MGGSPMGVLQVGSHKGFPKVGPQILFPQAVSPKGCSPRGVNKGRSPKLHYLGLVPQVRSQNRRHKGESNKVGPNWGSLKGGTTIWVTQRGSPKEGPTRGGPKWVPSMGVSQGDYTYGGQPSLVRQGVLTKWCPLILHLKMLPQRGYPMGGSPWGPPREVPQRVSHEGDHSSGSNKGVYQSGSPNYIRPKVVPKVGSPRGVTQSVVPQGGCPKGGPPSGEHKGRVP
jgi:hypothetical protein